MASYGILLHAPNSQHDHATSQLSHATSSVLSALRQVAEHLPELLQTGLGGSLVDIETDKDTHNS